MNLNTLYGTGWLRLNDDSREVERVGGGPVDDQGGAGDTMPVETRRPVG